MAGSALAILLRDKKEVLIERWSRRVQGDPAVAAAGRLAEPQIRDYVPEIIDQLCASLHERARHGEASGRGIGQSEPTHEHAQHRIAERYSLTEALRELSHFRLLLVDVCNDEGVAVEREEAKLVHAAIDESMSTVAVAMEEAAERDLRREVEFRDRFMGVLGHDLRNPLSSVVITAAALLKRPDTPPEHARSLQRIGRSTQRMERMINDLLDLTRSHSGGGIPVAPQPIELHAICRHVIDELQVTHPARAIVFEAQGDGHGVWDPDRLAQVVSNLVGNAIDYSPPDTPIQVFVNQQGAEIVFSVSNLGPQIPPEDLAGIFDPFRRGAHQRAPKGLGLGLFIAQQIVKAHGGTIDVRSAPHLGTTFTFRLPRGAPAKEP